MAILSLQKRHLKRVSFGKSFLSTIFVEVLFICLRCSHILFDFGPSKKIYTGMIMLFYSLIIGLGFRLEDCNYKAGCFTYFVYISLMAHLFKSKN